MKDLQATVSAIKHENAALASRVTDLTDKLAKKETDVLERPSSDGLDIMLLLLQNDASELRIREQETRVKEMRMTAIFGMKKKKKRKSDITEGVDAEVPIEHE